METIATKTQPPGARQWQKGERTQKGENGGIVIPWQRAKRGEGPQAPVRRHDTGGPPRGEQHPEEGRLAAAAVKGKGSHIAATRGRAQGENGQL